MPRTKKPAGTAVDKRNGRRAELSAAVPLERFSLPRRSDGERWLPETQKAWRALWDDPVVSVLAKTDRPVLLRWAGALHRAEAMFRLADSEPMVEGSLKQPVRNPLYDVADQQIRVAQACEQQIGIGALNRARLGVEFAGAQLSLMELNAALLGDDDEEDPRVA